MRPPRTWFGLRGRAESSNRRKGAGHVSGLASPDVGVALTAGTQLEEFVIERVLGAGGFGVTYLARDVSLDAWRAVKEYLPRGCGIRRRDGGVGPRSEADAKDYQWGRKQFLVEARRLALFDHRHIVRVYRVFEAWGTAYLVMEYINGRSLKAEIETGGVLSDDKVRTILLAITESLAAVHNAGLLHRDIKPDNVMLRPDGTPVLIDFGAARQMMGQSLSLRAVVSDGYAPIEQYSDHPERQGPWTDIYALGAVAYVALSGQVPAKAPDRVRTDPLPPVADAANHPVDAGLAAAVDAALAVDEAARPQSVAQWREMLVGAVTPPPDVPRGVTCIVGRAQECDVCLNDTSVSRNHADIVFLSDGRLYVTDRGSTNGTFVLDGGEWRAIHRELLLPTDRVRFGHCEMTAQELNAFLVRQEGYSPSGSTAEIVPGRPMGQPPGSAPRMDSAVDPRKGLVRNPKTGEIVEKKPPRGGHHSR